MGKGAVSEALGGQGRAGERACAYHASRTITGPALPSSYSGCFNRSTMDFLTASKSPAWDCGTAEAPIVDVYLLCRGDEEER